MNSIPNRLPAHSNEEVLAVGQSGSVFADPLAMFSLDCHSAQLLIRVSARVVASLTRRFRRC